MLSDWFFWSTLTAGMFLESLRDLLGKLWQQFSGAIDWLLQRIRVLPQQTQDIPKEFDVLLVQFIKITVALVLLLLFCYLFWMVLNKIIKVLEKVLLIALGIMIMMIAVFWIRGLP